MKQFFAFLFLATSYCIANPISSLVGARSSLVSANEELPYDSKVAYLESTGTQYIDTGIVADSRTSIEIDVQVVTYNDGCIGSWQGTGTMLYLNFYNSSVYYRYGARSLSRAESLIGWDTVAINHIEIGNGTIVANNTVVMTGIDVSGMDRNTRNFLLFAFNRNGTPALFCMIRIFSFKVYEDGNLVLDMIPVKKDGIGYLYDNVGGEFLGNVGTGEFVLGEDVR